MGVSGHAMRGLQPAGWLLVGTFTILGWIALHAGLLGLPLGALVLSWFFKYAFAVLESTAHGRPTLPVMSIEMVNPLEQRPLLQGLWCVIAWAPLWLPGGAVGLVAALLLSALLPATLAILGAGDRPIDAFNPASIARVIRGLGSSYFPILGFLALLCFAILWFVRHGHHPVLLWALVQVCTLAACSVLGGAVFERREALGFEAEFDPERTSEREASEREKARNRMLDEVHVPKRIRELDRLAEPLVPWIASASGATLADDARVIHARVRSWGDPAALGSITRVLVARLLADRQDSLALSLLVLARRDLPGLRAATDEETRRLAAHARATGQSRLAEQLEREVMGG